MNYQRFRKADLEAELLRLNIPFPPGKKYTKADLIKRLVENRERFRLAQENSYFTVDQCDDYSVKDLRLALKQRGANQGGSRADLCRRLAEFTLVEQARGRALRRDEPVVVTYELSDEEKDRLELPPLSSERKFTLDQCKGTTVDKLKIKLRQRHQPVSGKKEILCQRLAQYENRDLPATRQLHNLILIDPETFTGQRKRGGEFINGVKLSLNGRMYNLLQTDPQEYTSRKGRFCAGRTYVYGPLYDESEYTSLGSLEIFGTFALVDYDDYLQGQTRVVVEYQDFSEGPTEVKLMVHYNVEGIIDSLAIEDNCLFLPKR